MMTPEELEKLAAELDNNYVERRLNDAEKFILSLDLKPGNDLIECDIIYAKYFTWKRGNKLTKKQFFRLFKSRFESKRNNRGIVYYLDKVSLGLTDDEYWKLKRVERDEHQIKIERKRIREKNRQKERETCSSEGQLQPPEKA
jgi:hypothetical protein